MDRAKAARLLWFLNCLSTLVVYLFVIVGIVNNKRPGVPSISRILSDNPGYAPIIYVTAIYPISASLIAIICLYEGREKGLSANLIWFLITEVLSSSAFLWIVVADIDTNPGVHLFATGVTVVAALVGGATHNLEDKVLYYGKLATMGFIFTSALVFVCVIYTDHTRELTTPFSMLEYELYSSVTLLRNFNLYPLLK